MSEELFEAISAGDTDRVRALVGAETSLASARAPDGVSAARTACYRGHTEIVTTLVAAGAELDVFDAAALGRTDRLTAIVDREPGLVDTVATDGFTPLQLACFFGHTEAARLLLDRGADPAAVSDNAMAIHALNAAAAGGHTDIAALLLDAGADPDAAQHGGWTALMSAAANGDRATLDLLLEHGADPVARGDDGRDAVALAEERGHPAVADHLRARTA